jgi:hypothetical protein
MSFSLSTIRSYTFVTRGPPHYPSFPTPPDLSRLLRSWSFLHRRRAGPEPLSPALLAGVGNGRAPEVVVGLVLGI